jgi:hypothetical protein
VCSPIAIARLNGVEVELHELIEDLVVRLLGHRCKTFAMRAPEAVHDERGGQHSRRDVWVDRPKLAGLDPMGDDPGDQPVSAHHDFFGVKPREIWKVMYLGVNQPKQRSKL